MKTGFSGQTRLRVAALALVGVLCLAVQAQAGEFTPTKPIQMIAAAAPGGGSDVMARTIAPHYLPATTP